MSFETYFALAFAMFKSRRAMRSLNRGAGTVMIATDLVVAPR